MSSRTTTTSSATADLSVRLSIALAFADASVAVLALPQIVQRLHTSISHVTWVITAYNLALIATTVAMLPFARRLASRRALVAGLAVFGLASLGSGLADSLVVLVVWRCVQGAGAALLLCASLAAVRTRAPDGGTSMLQSWAATAAFGAAVGPAAGGDPHPVVRLAGDLPGPGSRGRGRCRDRDPGRSDPASADGGRRWRAEPLRAMNGPARSPLAR